MRSRACLLWDSHELSDTSLTSAVLGILRESQQPSRCSFFAMRDLWLKDQIRFLLLECKPTLCHWTHQTQWKVAIVLGACRQQGAGAAGSGGCFDPNLTYFALLLCLMLCLSCIVACTSSLCPGVPFQTRLSLLFCKDLQRVLVYEDFMHG